MSQTIRKVQFPSYGDISVIRIVKAEIPPPQKRQVQVDIMYSGFSGGDINQRKGVYFNQPSAPVTPGYCFIGHVATIGAGVSRFRKGDLVTALTVYDSEADKINIDEKYLFLVPQAVDPRQALALTLDWNTAYGLVHRAAKVSSGQRVFIHGVSGAVGYATMVLSQMQGATVYGTASKRNHEALRERGVTPFEYTSKDWIREMTALGGVDVVFDPLGFESYDESWSILARQEPSILVGYGGNMNVFQEGGKPRSQITAISALLAKNMCLWTKRSTSFYYIDRDRATFMTDLQALMEMLQKGQISPLVKHTWDLEDIQEAHRGYGKTPGMGSFSIRVSPDAY
ncbi:chaperonin 10-like protein [Stachybotrys elegans]|uniref:Chaperonin 10-like protein n=1 Tax=Stachybotrys elegans TaxID=80388 RepID=A0A8K0WP88_9HYPO|nr:chaperonin 10-like protein [Stachybotrys elegans]